MGIDEFIFSKIHGKNTTIDELQDNLNLFNSLVADIITEDGKHYLIEQRVRLELIDGIKIYINPKDHAPPHFHITYNSENTSFKIRNCELLSGHISPKIEQKIRYWYNNEGKSHVIEYWNKSRPTDDSVGEIKNE